MRLHLDLDDDKARKIGTAAAAGAVVATLLAPLHALARFATEDGKSDLDLPGVRAWAEPARDALNPMLDWGGADTVYVTYGKLWFPLFLAATLCALTVRARRGEVRGAEKWGWRIAAPGYVLLTASTFGDYWTPLLDESFMFLGVPGLLLSMVGSTTLGIGLLRRGFRPRATAVLLTAWIPGFLVLSDLIAMGAAALPFLWAYAVAGKAFANASPALQRDAALAA